MLQQTRSIGRVAYAGLHAATTLGRQPIAERADAVGRQTFDIGPREQLLAPVVAGLQAVDKPLLALGHRDQGRVVAGCQELPLFGQQP